MKCEHGDGGFAGRLSTPAFLDNRVNKARRYLAHRDTRSACHRGNDRRNSARRYAVGAASRRSSGAPARVLAWQAHDQRRDLESTDRPTGFCRYDAIQSLPLTVVTANRFIPRLMTSETIRSLTDSVRVECLLAQVKHRRMNRRILEALWGVSGGGGPVAAARICKVGCEEAQDIVIQPSKCSETTQVQYRHASSVDPYQSAR